VIPCIEDPVVKTPLLLPPGCAVSAFPNSAQGPEIRTFPLFLKRALKQRPDPAPCGPTQAAFPLCQPPFENVVAREAPSQKSPNPGDPVLQSSSKRELPGECRAAPRKRLRAFLDFFRIFWITALARFLKRREGPRGFRKAVDPHPSQDETEDHETLLPPEAKNPATHGNPRRNPPGTGRPGRPRSAGRATMADPPGRGAPFPRGLRPEGGRCGFREIREKHADQRSGRLRPVEKRSGDRHVLCHPHPDLGSAGGMGRAQAVVPGPGGAQRLRPNASGFRRRWEP